MDLHQIHMEDVFDLSLGLVSMSSSKVKFTRIKNGIFYSFGGLCEVYVWCLAPLKSLTFWRYTNQIIIIIIIKHV